MVLDRPSGALLRGEAGFGELIHQCSDFVELTGRTGDVVLLHPYTLHSASGNPSGRPRFITSSQRHPGRADELQPPRQKHYSPVEFAVLRALGVEWLDFRPKAPRERGIRSARRAR
ncbi:MAG: phytanoyl-CoA dioxygenase family protein [Spirochaetaceae bacterium]|nr:phytanoyl-CoA dioxygenase family protein [Spirochaetaceae bacterium]